MFEGAIGSEGRHDVNVVKSDESLGEANILDEYSCLVIKALIILLALASAGRRHCLPDRHDKRVCAGGRHVLRDVRDVCFLLCMNRIHFCECRLMLHYTTISTEVFSYKPTSIANHFFAPHSLDLCEGQGFEKLHV